MHFQLCRLRKSRDIKRAFGKCFARHYSAAKIALQPALPSFRRKSRVRGYNRYPAKRRFGRGNGFTAVSD